MTYLAISLLAFLALHMVPVVARMKAALLRRLGRPVYIALFALGSLVTLALVVHAHSLADYVPLFDPPGWARDALIAAMLPVCILLMSAIMQANLARWTRQPLGIAVSVWALGHLLANGDGASVLMFGSLALYSLASLTLRWVRATEPPAPLSWVRDAGAVGLGILLYLVLLLWFHPVIIGIVLV